MFLTSSIFSPITYVYFSSVERLLRSSDKGQNSFAPVEKIQFTRSPNNKPLELSKDFFSDGSIILKAFIKFEGLVLLLLFGVKTTEFA
jgi:hypothetical protein